MEGPPAALKLSLDTGVDKLAELVWFSKPWHLSTAVSDHRITQSAWTWLLNLRSLYFRLEVPYEGYGIKELQSVGITEGNI